MAINQWSPTALPTRPGLYINFKQAAIAAITGGVRGVVAMPLTYTSGTANFQEVYKVENEKQAVELFGVENVESIKLALQGGAKEVLVYTLPPGTLTADYLAMRQAFEAYPFNVFVCDKDTPALERDAIKLWLEQNLTEKKLFIFVAGGTTTDDKTPATGDTRSKALVHDNIVNLIVGGTIGTKTYSSAAYAPYVAGVIASAPINQSLTYVKVSLDDVNKRLRNSEIVTSLAAGSLVLVHDGEKVKIESGITTGKIKIRTAAARIAIATDIEKAARDNYIGKVNNDEDGQAALLSAIKVYLETLEDVGVLTDIVATLDPNTPSVGDQVFVLVSYRELDSMERVFLTISV